VEILHGSNKLFWSTGLCRRLDLRKVSSWAGLQSYAVRIAIHYRAICLTPSSLGIQYCWLLHRGAEAKSGSDPGPPKKQPSS